MTPQEMNLSNRLELAIEGSGFGVWQFDLTTSRLIWDAKMHEVYGHTHKPFSGDLEEWKQMVHPEDMPYVESRFSEIIAGKRVELFEFRIRSPLTNEIRYIEANGILDVDDHGNPVMVLGMNRDISESKKLLHLIEDERLTKITNSRLSAMGELAGGIAHEINNPLAIFAGQIQKLKKQISKAGDSNEEIEKSLQSMEKTVLRMSHIVKGLLSFVGGGLTPDLETKNFQDYIEETYQIMKEKIDSSGTTLVIKPRLQQFYLPVQSKAGQLSQVIVNLFANSIDAIENLKEKWIEVDLFECSGDSFVISVTDSGHGIAQEHQKKIATLFFTTKPTGKGSGLGLSISKKILNELGGSLNYNPQSPRTQFLIRLPLALIQKTAASTLGNADGRFVGARSS